MRLFRKITPSLYGFSQHYKKAMEFNSNTAAPCSELAVIILAIDQLEVVVDTLYDSN